MSEKTAKIELEVPIEVKRFIDALAAFTRRDTNDMNNYLTGLLLQGLLDGLDENTWNRVTKAIHLKEISEKYGLERLLYFYEEEEEEDF